MKTLRLITLLTFVLAIGLCSCSSDDEKKEETLSTQILGTWSVPFINPQKATSREELPAVINMQFKDDLTGIIELFNQDKEKTSSNSLIYKIDGKTVTIFADINNSSGESEDDLVILLKVSSINATAMVAEILDKDGFPLNKNYTGDYTFTKISK